MMTSATKQATSILYEGKAFLQMSMLSEDRKEELLDYIESAFADGKAAIYYQAILPEFLMCSWTHHIHDADMLKAYLTSIGNGRFFINRSFISKTPDVSMDRYRKFALACKTLEDRRLMMSFLLHCRIFHRVK